MVPRGFPVTVQSTLTLNHPVYTLSSLIGKKDMIPFRIIDAQRPYLIAMIKNKYYLFTGEYYEGLQDPCINPAYAIDWLYRYMTPVMCSDVPDGIHQDHPTNQYFRPGQKIRHLEKHTKTVNGSWS